MAIYWELGCCGSDSSLTAETAVAAINSFPGLEPSKSGYSPTLRRADAALGYGNCHTDDLPRIESNAFSLKYLPLSQVLFPPQGIELA